MGGNISSLFGETNDESTEDYLQLTDLGGFLSKYIFIMLDKDKRKLVSKQEYLILVNHFREQKTTEEELNNFLKRHVPAGQSTEYINEATFKKLIIQLAMDFDKNLPDRMHYLMTLFDKDNDGFVSETDLRQVYDAIGIQVPMEPIRSLIGKYDEDGDNRLSLKEFENLGRSAMSKLFIRKEEVNSPVDALVEEALRRGSASLVAAAQKSHKNNNYVQPGGNLERLKAENLANNNHIPNVDSNNNITTEELTIIDGAVFGKPVQSKTLESEASLFENINDPCDPVDLPLGETTTTNKVFFSDSRDWREGEGVKNVEGVLGDLQLRNMYRSS